MVRFPKSKMPLQTFIIHENAFYPSTFCTEKQSKSRASLEKLLDIAKDIETRKGANPQLITTTRATEDWEHQVQYTRAGLHPLDFFSFFGTFLLSPPTILKCNGRSIVATKKCILLDRCHEAGWFENNLGF